MCGKIVLRWAVNFTTVALDVIVQCRTALLVVLFFMGLVLVTDQSAEYLIVTAEKVRSNGRVNYYPTVTAFWCFSAALAAYSLLNLLDFARTRHGSLLSRYRGSLIVLPALIAWTPSAVMHFFVGARASAMITRRNQDVSLADDLIEVVAWNFQAITACVLASVMVWILINRGGLKRGPELFEAMLRVQAFILMPIVALMIIFLDLIDRLPTVIEKGALHIIILSCLTLLILLANAHYHLGGRGVPITMISMALFLATNVRGWNQPPPTLIAAENPALNLNLSAAHRDQVINTWLDRRVIEAQASGQLRVPLYVVAAQGGGSYAAYHAAKVLARLSQIDPFFASRLFAVSSVSGGSIGAVIYASSHPPTETVAVWGRQSIGERCRSVKMYWTSVEASVDRIFEADFVSPLVASFFRADVWREFGVLKLAEVMGLPVPARDKALSDAFQGAFRAQREADLGVFTQGTKWDLGLGPALFLNMTSRSGNRVYAAPFHVEVEDFGSAVARRERLWFQAVTRDRMSQLEAASFSARFPIVTPAGRIEVAGTSYRFLDGGYFDNSGLLTADDIRTVLRRAIERRNRAADRVEFEIVVLATTLQRIQKSTDVFPTKPDSFFEWLSPMTLQEWVRTSRGTEVAADFADRFKQLHAQGTVRERFLPLELKGDRNTLPLAWAISQQTRLVVKESVDSMDLTALNDIVAKCPATP